MYAEEAADQLIGGNQIDAQWALLTKEPRLNTAKRKCVHTKSVL